MERTKRFTSEELLKQNLNYFHYLKTGDLYLIEKFKIVVEHFVVGTFPSIHSLHEDQFIQQQRRKYYLVLSQCDIKLINLPSSIKKHASLHNILHVKVTQMTSDAAALKPSSVVQLFTLIHKEHLSVKGRINKQASLSFHAAVLFIGSAFVCNNSEDISETYPKDNTKSRNAVLVFKNKSIRFFHYLVCGCVYKLVKQNCDDVKVFEGGLNSQTLKKAMEKNDTSLCVFVSDDMDISHENSGLIQYADQLNKEVRFINSYSGPCKSKPQTFERKCLSIVFRDKIRIFDHTTSLT